MPKRANARPTCVSRSLVDGALGLRRMKRPVRAVGVERHRQPRRAEDAPRGGSSRPTCFRSDTARRGARAWSRRLKPQSDTGATSIAAEPRVHAAVEVQHFSETRARLPPQAMASTRPVALHQPRGLQRLLHEAVSLRGGEPRQGCATLLVCHSLAALHSKKTMAVDGLCPDGRGVRRLATHRVERAHVSGRPPGAAVTAKHDIVNPIVNPMLTHY